LRGLTRAMNRGVGRPMLTPAKRSLPLPQVRKAPSLMNQRVRAFLCLAALSSVALLILAGDIDQRKYSGVEIFVNIDHSDNGRFDGKTGCSTRVPVPDSSRVRVVEESLICGHPGHVSKVTWKFLRTSPKGDVYKISRLYPSDSDAPGADAKEVTYSGKPLTLWKDDHQKIVLRPVKDKEPEAE